MIGLLPKFLDINGTSYEIYSDYRVALLIFEVFEDERLSNQSKWEIAVDLLFKEKITDSDFPQACEISKWYLDGGNCPKSEEQSRPILNWEQDESIIFPALNKVAGKEIREVEYMHWWTFLGLFNEIDEGLYSTVIGLRVKLAKGKKLEKWEKEFYREHRSLIEIKRKLTAAEKAENDFVDSLFY